MAQPDNRQNGNRPPGGAPDPNFNWRGVVLFAIALMLLGGALIFPKPAGMGGSKEVPYPEFVAMLEKEEIILNDTKYPVELVAQSSSANEIIRAFRKPGSGVNAQPERIITQVNLMFLQDNLYKLLEK